MTRGTDPKGDGNRSHNSNAFSVDSPTHNHGYQHTTTSAPGGTTSVQNALCRRAKVCNITQKVILITPWKADKATSNSATTAIPQKVDAPASDQVKTLTPEDVASPLGLDLFFELSATINVGAGLLGGTLQATAPAV